MNKRNYNPMKHTWKDYDFSSPFEMLQAAYAGDVPIEVQVAGENDNRIVRVNGATPRTVNVTDIKTGERFSLWEDDVSFSSRL